MKLVLISIALLLGSCQLNSVKPEEVSKAALPRLDTHFMPAPSFPSETAIHSLSEEQAESFLQYFNQATQYKPHARVYQYLDELTENYSYHHDTLSAEQSLSAGRGNCMSLAILTTALARLAGVETEYQLVESDPVFSIADLNIVKGIHIRTKLIDNSVTQEPGSIMLWRPGMIIDYFPDGSERFVGNVAHENYMARYFINLAVASLEQNKLKLAYWQTLEAIKYDRSNEDAINLLAIIYRRANKPTLAEATYRYGLDEAENHLSLLKNYRLLLISQSRTEEADEIQKTIDRLHDPSPHNWYLAGLKAYDDGHMDDAIKFLKRAERIAPYIHQIHFGLARAYYQKGNEKLAEQYLIRAREAAYKPTIQRIYDAKIAKLTQ